MNTARKVKKIFKSKPTMEGAGVHLKRAFGFNEVPMFDPFLMLDDFRSAERFHYEKGFPWHPHRGIETITYVLQGDVEHGDSMGNRGMISSGDVQWMTAGSGIVHQEMPKGNPEGLMLGFQLWANLPASAKMMPPRYRDVPAATIPEVEMENGVKVKIICGRLGDVQGPVQDIIIEPEYLDVQIPAGATFVHPTIADHTVFAYVIDGRGCFDRKKGVYAANESLVLWDKGERVVLSTEARPARLLLVSGRPIGEPIAWQGPIVMNTQEELALAFRQYRQGTFIQT